MKHKHYYFFINKNKEPLRIDKFLLKNIFNITRNKIQNLFKTDKIYVNNFLVKKNYKINPLDLIRVTMNYSKKNITKDFFLNIIYEDDILIVINKQSGFIVHKGSGNNKITLLHTIKYYLNNIGIKSIPNRMGLVHRLDKETSGLLLIAKNDFSLQHLTYQFFIHKLYKCYITLVWGNLEGYGTIHGYIGRSSNNKKRMEIFSNIFYGKHSVTHYKVIEKFNIVTLVTCRIDTGRTHQIRAHMCHIGHPIFNDIRYGKENNKQKKIIKEYFSTVQGQFLHAQSFIFIHPITGKPMHFEIPLPKKMYNVLEKFRNEKLLI